MWRGGADTNVCVCVCVCVWRAAGLQIQMCLGGCIHTYIYVCVCVYGGKGGGSYMHTHDVACLSMLHK